MCAYQYYSAFPSFVQSVQSIPWYSECYSLYSHSVLNVVCVWSRNSLAYLESGLCPISSSLVLSQSYQPRWSFRLLQDILGSSHPGYFTSFWLISHIHPNSLYLKFKWWDLYIFHSPLLDSSNVLNFSSYPKYRSWIQWLSSLWSQCSYSLSLCDPQSGMPFLHSICHTFYE